MGIRSAIHVSSSTRRWSTISIVWSRRRRWWNRWRATELRCGRGTILTPRGCVSGDKGSTTHRWRGRSDRVSLLQPRWRLIRRRCIARWSLIVRGWRSIGWRSSVCRLSVAGRWTPGAAGKVKQIGRLGSRLGLSASVITNSNFGQMSLALFQRFLNGSLQVCFFLVIGVSRVSSSSDGTSDGASISLCSSRRLASPLDSQLVHLWQEEE